MISLSGGIIAASISHVVRSSVVPAGAFSSPHLSRSRCSSRENLVSEFWCMCAPLTTRVLQPSWLGSRGALSPFFSHKPKSLAVVFFLLCRIICMMSARCISNSRLIFLPAAAGHKLPAVSLGRWRTQRWVNSSGNTEGRLIHVALVGLRRARALIAHAADIFSQISRNFLLCYAVTTNRKPHPTQRDSVVLVF